MLHAIRQPRATVSLVALCFVAVLGIVLASYLGVCSRAMNLSNRSFQVGLGKQLAELGLEDALRAFNRNDWSNWASAPSGMSASAWSFTNNATTKRATRTITLPASSLGQGTTATIKLRIENYDAAELDSTYSSSTTYRINDLIGYNGIWYRSLKNNNSGNTPSLADLTWWVQEPIPWKWNSNYSYSQFDAVNYNGTWYRSNIDGNTSTPPGANWASISQLSLSWSSSVTYTSNAIVYNTSDNTWYRSVFSNTNRPPATSPSYWTALSPSNNISFAYQSTVAYSFGDVVYYPISGTGTWRRCKFPTPTDKDPTNTTYWEDAVTSIWNWSAGSLKYNLGDTVYYSNRWYRCILAHTSSGAIVPSSASSYWSGSPQFSNAWDAGRQYSVNDLVIYNGVWFRCRAAHNNSIPSPTSNTANWYSAAVPSNYWTATNYSVGAYVSYGGSWYKCTASATKNESPNNYNYWTPTWTNSFGVSTGAPIIYAEATISIANSPPIRTQLRTSISAAPLFPNVLAASTTLQIAGGGTIDSYDSGAGTSGGFSAVIAAGNTSSTAVSIASTTVKGYLAVPSSTTSPYGPLFSHGGKLQNEDGSVTLPASGNGNVDLTRVSRSPNIPQFDTIPSGADGLASSWGFGPRSVALNLSSTTDIGTPGATTPSRYYSLSSLTFSNASSGTVLNVNGPVVLYVQGNLTLDASGVININSTGSLELHLTGALKVKIGSDGINNRTKDPKNLVIVCDTTSATAQNYSDGTVPFYGLIYAPYLTATDGMTFDDSSTLQFYGAVSAKKITYNVDANVHYDSSLRYASIPGVDQPYAVTELRELPLTEQAAMP